MKKQVLTILVFALCCVAQSSNAQLQNAVIPGPLVAQVKVSNSYDCHTQCEGNASCVAWVYGPDPLPAGVKFNCGLKSSVTGAPIEQANVTSGYSSRFQPTLLHRDRVVPGPILSQYTLPIYDFLACSRVCEQNPQCKAWVFGPMAPLVPGQKNCVLKGQITGGLMPQANVVSGYSSRYHSTGWSRDSVISGPLFRQVRADDYDFHSCREACGSDPQCKAWVFGPMPLPGGVKYNCGLKSAVTGAASPQANVVSGNR